MEKIIISEKLLKIVNKAAQNARMASAAREIIEQEIENMGITYDQSCVVYECVSEYVHYGQFTGLSLEDIIDNNKSHYRSMDCPYCKQVSRNLNERTANNNNN